MTINWLENTFMTITITPALYDYGLVEKDFVEEHEFVISSDVSTVVDGIVSTSANFIVESGYEPSTGANVPFALDAVTTKTITVSCKPTDIQSISGSVEVWEGFIVSGSDNNKFITSKDGTKYLEKK